MALLSVHILHRGKRLCGKDDGTFIELEHYQVFLDALGLVYWTGLVQLTPCESCFRRIPEAKDMFMEQLARKYTYRILWSITEQEHLGLCSELPELSYSSVSPIEALQGILGAVKAELTQMSERKEMPPIPFRLRRDVCEVCGK